MMGVVEVRSLSLAPGDQPASFVSRSYLPYSKPVHTCPSHPARCVSTGAPSYGCKSHAKATPTKRTCSIYWLKTSHRLA